MEFFSGDIKKYVGYPGIELSLILFLCISGWPTTEFFVIELTFPFEDGTSFHRARDCFGDELKRRFA